MHFHDDDLLVEARRVGTWQRVVLLHVGSGREAVVHGPATMPLACLVALARRQLDRSRRPSAPTNGAGIVA